jgi:hypothetical protein
MVHCWYWEEKIGEGMKWGKNRGRKGGRGEIDGGKKKIIGGWWGEGKIGGEK